MKKQTLCRPAELIFRLHLSHTNQCYSFYAAAQKCGFIITGYSAERNQANNRVI